MKIMKMQEISWNLMEIVDGHPQIIENPKELQWFWEGLAKGVEMVVFERN